MDRLGAWFRRWEPWPHVVVFGGGGILLILKYLTWGRPEHSLRLWIGVGLGIASILLGYFHLWVYASSRGDADRRHPAQPN